MAIGTYAELQTAVANWLERDDLTTRIPEFIALAEAAINRELRVRKMVTRATATISSAFSAVPSDYLEAKSVTLSDGTNAWELDPAPEAVIANYATEQQTGEPRFFSVVGDEFQYYPTPSASYTATLTYYARIPALSDSATTNWLLTTHPDAYLYGSLLQAAPYLRDNDALQIYGAGYTAALTAVRAAERTQAGKLRVDSGLMQRRSYNIYRDI